MADLNYAIGAGENDYVAFVAGPASPSGQGGPSLRIPALQVLDLAEPVPAGGVKVEIPAGAQQVVAALRDAEGNVPAGVRVTVTQPDGTAFTQSTTPYDPKCVVLIQDGSLTDLLVCEPQVGQWTIQMESTNSEDEFQFFFSTLPTANVQRTIDKTLSSMSNQEVLAALEANWEAGESWDCFWCKFGCTALGIVLLALVAAGLTYVTAGAAPVIALATYLSISASAAAASIIGIATGVSLTLAALLLYICSWAEACPSPGTAM